MGDSVHSDARWFLTTHWSVVQAAGGDSTRALAALERLCQTHWYPLYAYARRAGLSAHDAEDSTQAFFLKCLEKDTLSAADQARGRFRSFLLTAFKRFVANEQKKARTHKRGGGKPLVELDALKAEERYALEPANVASADKLFERRWAMTLLARVLERFEREQAAAGNTETFEALKEFLQGSGRGTPYAKLAAQLGVSESVVKVTVHRLRKRYRELLNDEIANTVSSPDEVEEERRHLFDVMGS